MRSQPALSLVPLLWVVVADYVAQVPYYLVNYYLPYRTAPTVSSVVLLGLTLAWFLLGYFGRRAGWRIGYWLLLTFLLVEGLFYLHTLLFGAVFFQLANPNVVIKIVFVIGYVTGIVSLVYFALLIVFRSRFRVHATVSAK